ncbi:MAG: hypothetical protein ACYDAL_02695 [Candidatus Dormibacteraceae bacterium]|jgi:hypothetical protein
MPQDARDFVLGAAPLVDDHVAAPLPLVIRLWPLAIPTLAVLGVALAVKTGTSAALLPLAVWLGSVQLDSL